MNSLRKYFTIVSILVANLKYYEEREIPATGNINFKYNYKQSTEQHDKIRPSEENATIRDGVVTVKLQMRETLSHLKNSFLDYISSILWRSIAGDTPQMHKTTKIRRDVGNKKGDSDQNQIYLSPDKVSALDSNGNDYFEWDKNLTDSPSYDANEPFNDTYINGTFNDTDTNETMTPIIELTTISAVLPVCTIGDDNCTKCQEISPFCHYMYSESRCVYYNYVHASKLYECGDRWFTFDKNEALFATALVTFVISSSLLGYLIYLRYTVGYEREIPLVATDEYVQMRRVIQLMHEKYPQVAKDIQQNSSQ